MTVVVHTVQWGTWPGERPHRQKVTCGICGRTIGFRPIAGTGTWACRQCRADTIVLHEVAAVVVVVDTPGDSAVD